MACYYPLTQYKSIKNPVNEKTGRPNYVFNTKEGHYHTAQQIPCGQCWGCRLERSRMWAIRCLHEKQFHDHNQFLTLTYNDENIPNHNTLLVDHLKSFWKRVRLVSLQEPELDLTYYKTHRHPNYRNGKPRLDTLSPIFKYFACGEYGDITDRPHYHAICFGLNLTDKEYLSTSNGNKLYTSETLKRLWPHGNAYIGNVTFESCAYVARYIMKKITGHAATPYYSIHDEDGQYIGQREPEFLVMSRRPSISREFYLKYKNDIYQQGTDGKVIVRGGVTCTPPRLYEEMFEKENLEHYNNIKKRRKLEAKKNQGNNTRERLIVREQIALSIINKRLPRNLE